MRLQRVMMQRAKRGLCVFGDCSCGHSFAYHMPLAGCMKCSCDEFR